MTPCHHSAVKLFGGRDFELTEIVRDLTLMILSNCKLGFETHGFLPSSCVDHEAALLRLCIHKNQAVIAVFNEIQA